MKGLLKSNIKFIIGFVFGAIIFGSLCAYAVSVASNDVTYDNTNSGSSATTVKAAIDDLYDKVDGSNCKIINIYSATNDTIYYYDNGVKKDLCTTDASGRAVIASLPKNNITLYSTIAKDPSNLSNPYSKSVSFSDSTSNIYLMPSDGEAMIYWYGYKGSNFISNIDNSFSWRNSATNATINATYRSDNINFTIVQPYTGSGTHVQQAMITGTIDLSSYSHAKSVVNLSHSQAAREIVTSGARTTYPTISWVTTAATTAYDNTLSSGIYDVDISSISSGNIGYMQYCDGAQTVTYSMTLYASWLE